MIKNLKSQISNLKYAAIIFACAAAIVGGLFHGMVSEVELRELKADRGVYNTILTDRALLEHQADKAQRTESSNRSRLTAHEASR